MSWSYTLTLFDWIAFATTIIGSPIEYLELFKPKQADKIEVWIDRRRQDLFLWGNKMTGSRFFDIALTISILLFFFLMYVPVAYFSPQLNMPDLHWSIWTLIGLFFLIPVIGIGSQILVGSIDWLNNFRYTKGRALGAIGAVILFIGAFCDIGDKVLSPIVEPPTPTISAFEPRSGQVGTSITITGTDFDPTPSKNIVLFGGKQATISAATDTQLTIIVPTTDETFNTIEVVSKNCMCFADDDLPTPDLKFEVKPLSAGLDANLLEAKAEVEPSSVGVQAN